MFFFFFLKRQTKWKINRKQVLCKGNLFMAEPPPPYHCALLSPFLLTPASPKVRLFLTAYPGMFLGKVIRTIHRISSDCKILLSFAYSLQKNYHLLFGKKIWVITYIYALIYFCWMSLSFHIFLLENRCHQPCFSSITINLDLHIEC